MKTTQIDGTEIRGGDDQITAKLAKCKGRFGGNTMRIGIRNEKRIIYRNVETDGLDEFMKVIACLQDFNLTDELEESNNMKDGYDAIFSDTP